MRPSIVQHRWLRFVLLAVPLACCATLHAAEQPNIVLIMADDFGYECVTANGGQSYQTPHLDRLAAGGMRFEQCHVQPLCTPTRVQLMTGRYNVRNYLNFGTLVRTETSFAQLLKRAGYVTGICGKWQLGREPDAPGHFGFDESFLWQHTRRPPRYANPGLEHNGVPKDFTSGEYGPQLVNDFAIDFVTRHKDKPFFLYYPMILTHNPFQPTPDSPNWDPKAQGERVNQSVKHFADMTAFMDKMIGRLDAKLAELGIRDKTLLMFLGDNGTHGGVTSRLNGADYQGGKGTTTRRGHHVPFIASWPAVMKEGRVNRDLISAADFLPTICEAAGVKTPPNVDGVSFLPQLAGEQGAPRQWLYCWYSPRQRRNLTVREFAFDHGYKLYRTGQLFDLQADPFEQKPLNTAALTGDQQAAQAKLKAVLDQFRDARPVELDRQFLGEIADDSSRPHIVFVMADDMGWGQTGYRNHPLLKTPNLDAMAANGLRFERFYAGCPVCSPTRASVLTGRSPDRAGVLTHGYALRLQERTIAQALKDAGYVTGHFGKWHLNGFKGPGAPILRDDPRSPGAFGFDEWVSVTNFYDVDPLLSRAGEIEQFHGDSSEIAVAEAVKFLDKHRGAGRPMFAVVWFGTPHSPFKALPADKARFDELDEASANHYGELVALDRAVGTLRTKLRELQLADQTLLVFCSDNGGLPRISKGTVGGLRGFKGSVYEGGLRVPGIIEWPAVIQSRVTSFPACTMDLFPTVADLLDLPGDVFVRPLDGISLRPLLTAEIAERAQPIPFRFGQKLALIDNRYKLLSDDRRTGAFQLYDLHADPQESRDVSGQQPEVFLRLKRELLAWNEAVDASFAGRDYPEGKVLPADPQSISWYEAPQYAPYLSQWKDRWEFQSYLQRPGRGSGGTKKK